MPKNLAQWLSYIESLHTKPIAMGLDRVQAMIRRAALKPDFTIITVAGTNGKGSTCAMLEAIYTHAGYRVGCYSSPHLLRYNERVRVNGNEVSDAELCAAFAAIEQARLGNDDAIALTYFEIGTLAAMWHFIQADIDVAILEIGLGGRLDAVNAFEPSCAIVTSVDLDHQDFLGDTREKIGMEKAGVYRQSLPAICGDRNPPDSLMAHARAIRADLQCIGPDFSHQLTANGWRYLRQGAVVYDALPLPALQGDYQLDNATCALTAITAMQAKLPVAVDAISKALAEVKLAGRFQTVLQTPHVILDVAHNPHAAVALVHNLQKAKLQKAVLSNDRSGKTFAVFAMLADKDVQGVVDLLKDEIDVWYVASIQHARGALAADVADAILAADATANIHIFDQIEDAYTQACLDIQACIDGSENDKIVVFGSIFTVSSIMQLLEADHPKSASLRK